MSRGADRRPPLRVTGVGHISPPNGLLDFEGTVVRCDSQTPLSGPGAQVPAESLTPRGGSPEFKPLRK